VTHIYTDIYSNNSFISTETCYFFPISNLFTVR